MLGVRFVSRATHIKRLAEKKALSHDLNHARKPLSLLPIHPNHVWKLLNQMGVMITQLRRTTGVWGLAPKIKKIYNLLLPFVNMYMNLRT
jgi:hypothetical protein